MSKSLTVIATVPLSADPFEAAEVIARAKPLIEALRDGLAQLKGASLVTTFDGRSAPKNGAAPVARRKRRAAGDEAKTLAEATTWNEVVRS